MRKTFIGAVAALAIGLAGCTTGQDNTNRQNYPEEAKENFVEDCTANALKARPGDEQRARETCGCVIRKLEESGLPYDRENNEEASFKDADQAIKDGKDLPADVKDDFDRASADCRR